MLNIQNPNSDMPRRLRVLLSAYYCSPYRGGESTVGWKVATELAAHHDVTVLCGDLSPDSPTLKDHQRFSSESELPAGLTILHIQAHGLACAFHKAHSIPGLWFLYYEAYRVWQQEAFKQAKELHSDQPFDVIHHVTVIGFREPGYLWQLETPFFWGPISGAPQVPDRFLKDFSLPQRFRWKTRNILNRFQIKNGGRAKSAAIAAAKIWVVSEEDRNALLGWGVNAAPMLETGSTPVVTREPKTRALHEPLRLCWSGLFQGIKALPLLLRALVDSEFSNVQLDVLGHGPEATRWKSLAATLGLESRVSWHGMLPREEAMRIMQNSHVLFHTSVKEGTPHVVLEALTMGLPVVCHNACGMGIAVDARCGIKIALKDPATSSTGFRDAIRRLLTEPELLPTLSAGAYERAGELSWESKVEAFSLAYREAISTTA
jgi:glycosyltransferase involved in cell wall biosynthesis